MRRILSWGLGALLIAGVAAAAPAQDEQSADGQAAAQIRTAIKALNPNLRVDSVAATPLPGIYEVVIGGQIAYVSGDGRYLVQGNILDMQKGESISEPRRAALRLDKINAIGEQNMLIYEPSGETKAELTIFTDIDCPYCRKLHRDIDRITGAGVRVRYLLMPRAGIGSSSYQKAVNAWCAEDRQAALTRAKGGERLPKGDCEHPVVEHLELARELGISATPTIVLEDGSIESGYRNYEYLMSVVGVEPVSPGKAKALGPRKDS